MKFRIIPIVLLAGSLPVWAALPGESAISPMVGTWEATLPNGCVERHTFRADGFMSGTSGVEYVEEKYTFHPLPDEGGFHKLEGLTLNDTGGPDCGDSIEDHSGKSWTAYIVFSPDKNMHLVCAEPRLATCWGPYRRIQPNSPR